MHRTLPRRSNPHGLGDVDALRADPRGAPWPVLDRVRAIDWMVCVGLYFARMFFITGGYHRYFAHRTYKMGRVMQFLMAAAAGPRRSQKGVLWWAAHHRKHHKFSDQPGDVHSPKDGLGWAHVRWILCHAARRDRLEVDQGLCQVPGAASG